MPKPANKASATMNAELTPLLPQKIAITASGLEVTAPLTLDEWRELGRHFGRAMNSAAFVVGDWLVYGEGRAAQLTLWPEIAVTNQVETHVYTEAVTLTGMDRKTLHNYAYVARHVPRSLRNEHVSWEHHKRVAKLRDPAEKAKWLQLAADKRSQGEPVSVRRFARSIEAGRLLSPQEIEAGQDDEGIENVHPHVNRIVAFFARLRESGWLRTADAEKRAALKRDLHPIIEIYNQL